MKEFLRFILWPAGIALLIARLLYQRLNKKVISFPNGCFEWHEAEKRPSYSSLYLICFRDKSMCRRNRVYSWVWLYPLWGFPLLVALTPFVWVFYLGKKFVDWI